MIIEIRDEVVSLSGAVRKNQWAALESAVNLRLRQHPAGIVLDCSGVEAITAEGCETIRDAAAHVAAHAAGARLVLAAVPPHVVRVLRQVPNLGSQVPVAVTVEEARRSLGLTPVTARSGGAGIGRSSGGRGEVLVGLLGSDGDAHAAAVGCRIASLAAAPVPAADGGRPLPAAQRPRLHLIRLLQVPRDRPLLSALGPEEEEAAAGLARFEEAVRGEGLLPVPRMERTRNPAARLLELSGDLRAAVIVLALGAEATDEEVSMVERVVSQARCEVVVDRLRPSGTGPVPAPLGVPAPHAAGSANGARGSGRHAGLPRAALLRRLLPVAVAGTGGRGTAR